MLTNFCGLKYVVHFGVMKETNSKFLIVQSWYDNLLAWNYWCFPVPTESQTDFSYRAHCAESFAQEVVWNGAHFLRWLQKLSRWTRDNIPQRPLIRSRCLWWAPEYSATKRTVQLELNNKSIGSAVCNFFALEVTRSQDKYTHTHTHTHTQNASVVNDQLTSGFTHLLRRHIKRDCS